MFFGRMGFNFSRCYTGAPIDLPVIPEVEAQPRLSGILQQIPVLCDRASGRPLRPG